VTTWNSRFWSQGHFEFWTTSAIDKTCPKWKRGKTILVGKKMGQNHLQLSRSIGDAPFFAKISWGLEHMWIQFMTVPYYPPMAEVELTGLADLVLTFMQMDAMKWLANRCWKLGRVWHLGPMSPAFTLRYRPPGFPPKYLNLAILLWRLGSNFFGPCFWGCKVRLNPYLLKIIWENYILSLKWTGQTWTPYK
jgi:hypothetical protein